MGISVLSSTRGDPVLHMLQYEANYSKSTTDDYSLPDCYIGICKKLAKPQKKERKKSEKVCTFWFCTGMGRILHRWLACTWSVTYSLKQLLSPFLMAECKVEGIHHGSLMAFWWLLLLCIIVEYDWIYNCLEECRSTTKIQKMSWYKPISGYPWSFQWHLWKMWCSEMNM